MPNLYKEKKKKMCIYFVTASYSNVKYVLGASQESRAPEVMNESDGRSEKDHGMKDDRAQRNWQNDIMAHRKDAMGYETESVVLKSNEWKTA